MEPALVLAPEIKVVKLDLACGQTPREGFEGVDFHAPGAKHKVDLWKFPYPWADNSVDEIHCCLPDSLVDTKKGKRKISSIRIGDVVRGCSGWVVVEKIYRRTYNGRVYRIAAPDGVIVVTEDHPIATPSGWVKAHKLRVNDALGLPPVIQPAHFVDIGEIEKSIRTLPSPRANRSGPIPVGNASITKTSHDFSLRHFTDQVRLTNVQHRQDVFHTSHGHHVHPLPAIPVRFVTTQRTRDTLIAKKGSTSISNRRVRVNDTDLHSDLRMRGDIEVDGPLAIDNTSKPSSISVSHIKSILSYEYSGDVYNLKTSDETFYINSILTHNCSHFVEHLPARDVEERDVLKKTRTADFVGQDFFFAFFDECWRILKPDGTMTVIVPCARNNRAFQDPTHRRFIVAETFAYLWRDWRVAQKLDHYNVRCNFVSNVNHTMPTELTLKSAEVQARMFNECWNVIYDWHATLKAVK